jgi:hypothetical protein
MSVSARYDASSFNDPVNDLRLERDSLRTRVRILEAALTCIGREAELPSRRPETSFIAVHRIASVVRQSLEEEPDTPPISGLRPIARAKC